jgi:lysophospholipase L1-like esterase
MTTINRLLCFALGFLIGNISPGAMADNVVYNPSFEEGGGRGMPLGWGYYLPAVPQNNPLQLVRGDGAIFSIDTTTAKDGVRSICISSQDPVRCSLSQNLPLKPGQTVKVTVWMKGENLDTGDNRGACVRLGFVTRAGADLLSKIGRSNLYLRSKQSTFDWTQMSGEVVIPEGTETVALECYLWQSRGTAWFDAIDVELTGVAGEAPEPMDPANKKRYREANAQLPTPVPGEKRVVFIGDSIIDNWKLEKSFPDGKYINRGIGGQRIPQICARFADDALALKPRAILVLAGTNDLAAGESDDNIVANLESIIRLCHDKHVPVIICSLLPVSDYHQDKNANYARTAKRPPERIAAINRKFESLCSRETAFYLDLHKNIADSTDRMPARYSEDGLHPNAEGYALLAPLVSAEIESVLATKPE